MVLRLEQPPHARQGAKPTRGIWRRSGTGTVESVSVEVIAPIPDELQLAAEILRHIIKEYGDANFPAPHHLNDAVWVGYRLSEVLPLKLSTKQNLLEMNDSVERLRILSEILKKQIN